MCAITDAIQPKVERALQRILGTIIRKEDGEGTWIGGQARDAAVVGGGVLDGGGVV